MSSAPQPPQPHQAPHPPLRAIVLAAGRGERMRPLTDHTPKPLLPVAGRPLIEWQLLALARDGVQEAVVNTAWLEHQFPAALGDGSRLGMSLRYSHEGAAFGQALETAGGIAQVQDWLCEDGRPAFWVVSADIWSPDFRFDAELARRFIASGLDAHLWLVPNPPFHPRGDFACGPARVDIDDAACLAAPIDAARPGATYANLALMRTALCRGVGRGQRAALGPLLHEAVAQGRISVSMHGGRWENVGTPAQWQALQPA
ncbi:nucleotidyltransferase family protein [Sphaerotilus mobilis]|uniref:MurNAc alpha-1-phosphate uridylyltransferase n=1 Tax=Sphaerotilus mobilis TaxID=47994 RepID=A0A4Q7LLL3_9BURK|nr:nucleotidyltransferase family protein [Sphaerotilus mobilis]RZS54429.1 MurNAc alpha-1-phosphate uridylyltransferase [Sphaerotilus mobilis]